jgi:hypothetical protein
VVDPKGPALGDCTACHNPSNYSLFGPDPGQTLAETDVCDECHSPDGAFDGINDLVVGAKPNWESGIYNAKGKTLKEGKDDWCATCHDDGTSLVGGVPAPNVMGDDLTYGYNQTGHGRNALNYVPCGGLPGIACHDLTVKHFRNLGRTYNATSTKTARSYRVGYRLNDDLVVPRTTEGAPASFKLCTNCHIYTDIVDKTITNFRIEGESRSLHLRHLEDFGTILCWDSDWNGDIAADSTMNCTACHNVHGSPSSVMIRHGELIGHVPALDFKWFQADGVTETTQRSKSQFGTMQCANAPNLSHNGVCWGCHPALPPEPTLITYERVPNNLANVTVNEVKTTNLTDVETDKDTFAVGEDIRFYVNFTVNGPPGSSYYVKSPPKKSRAFNTSDADWFIKLGRTPDEPLLSGLTYEWTWNKTVPPEAEVGSGAQVDIQIRILEGLGGATIDRDMKSKTFSIVAPTP